MIFNDDATDHIFIIRHYHYIIYHNIWKRVIPLRHYRLSSTFSSRHYVSSSRHDVYQGELCCGKKRKERLRRQGYDEMIIFIDFTDWWLRLFIFIDDWIFMEFIGIADDYHYHYLIIDWLMILPAAIFIIFTNFHLSFSLILSSFQVSGCCHPAPSIFRFSFSFSFQVILQDFRNPGPAESCRNFHHDYPNQSGFWNFISFSIDLFSNKASQPFSL